MLEFLANNLSTIIVGLIVAILIGLAVYAIRRDKKQGKSSCGNNCAHCQMSGQCHSTATSKRK